ncbi:MAG: flavin reductase family protein [Acidobacteria bacterium]|nr:flavin reductase family protein [Acidobacteriota bacterium]
MVSPGGPTAGAASGGIHVPAASADDGVTVNPAGADGSEKVSLGAKTAIIPTPVWVIGSYDKEGKPNLMTAAWVGICASTPPSVMVCLREATYSHGNIMGRKAFTVNIASESLARHAAYVGRVSGKSQDKFLKTGLTPVKSTRVDAPFVKEFPLVVECKVIRTVEVGSHTMFIGEIVDVKAAPSILSVEGVPDMGKLKPFVFSPGSSQFYGIGPSLGRVSELAKEEEK